MKTIQSVFYALVIILLQKIKQSCATQIVVNSVVKYCYRNIVGNSEKPCLSNVGILGSDATSKCLKVTAIFGLLQALHVLFLAKFHSSASSLV